MGVELRPYQAEAVERVRESLRSGARAPLLVAPTGAGKTVIFSHITEGAARKGKRVMILAHRSELLDQTSRALRGLGVPHGMIAAGRTPDWREPVQIAGVQTLVRRLDRALPPDLLIIDEAHHSAAGSWKAIIAAYPKARVLGVTATPERLDGRGLGDVFDDLIRGPEVADLIGAGYLSRPVYYAPPGVDLVGVRTTAGDFNRGDAEKAVDKPRITGDAVGHYQRLCDGVPAVAFCVSIRHAEHVTEQFRAAGYRWATLDGNMTPESRRQAVTDLGLGRLHGLSSCDIISEGFDLPCVTAAILLRPTKSLSLFLQQVGRVLRVHDGKTHAIILDHVGNVPRHGLAEEVREWTLDGAKARKKKAVKDEFRNRQCPACYGVHAFAPTCPLCGHEYVVKAKAPEQVEGELQELTAEQLAAAGRRKEQGRAQSLQDLIAIGQSRGYKNPAAWAGHIFAARGRKFASV